VIVISDFFGADDWQRPFARLATAHQMLAVQVVDPRELALPAAGMLALVDTETGRHMHIQTNSAKLRARYAAAARNRQQTINERIRRAGGDHLVLTTDRDWLIDIVKFVANRRVVRHHALERTTGATLRTAVTDTASVHHLRSTR
jgi:uncharacterized protein (DUF58 family)